MAIPFNAESRAFIKALGQELAPAINTMIDKACTARMTAAMQGAATMANGNSLVPAYPNGGAIPYWADPSKAPQNGAKPAGSCGCVKPAGMGGCAAGACTVNVGGIGAGCPSPAESPGDTIAGNSITILPPGSFNCEPDDGKQAPCDVDRIIRTRRRFVVQGDTTAATMTVSTALATQLDTPAGFSWYVVTIDPVLVSHQICPRDFAVVLDDGAGGGGPVTPEDVAIQTEGVYADGDGNYVLAWSFPKPADPDDLKITEGRCACERLCDCQRARGEARVGMLLPTLGGGESYTATIKGVRDCWRVSCGSCPPDDLCGRELTGN